MAPSSAAEGCRPGTKRLSVSLSLLAWVALGLPVWWHLTLTYRSPEFFEAIKEVGALGEEGLLGGGLRFAPADLQVVLVGPPAGWAPPGGEEEFGAMVSHELAGTAAGTPGVTLSTRVQGGMPAEWGVLPPGDLDEWLAGQPPASGGLAPASAHGPQYTLYVVPDDRVAGGPRAHLGKHRHGWVRARSEDWAEGGAQLVPMVARAAAWLAVDGGLSLPTAPLPPGGAVLSFTLCVADPVATGHVTWDFEGAASAYLEPVAEALERAAGSVSVESRAIGFCRGRGEGTWSAEHGAHLLPHSAASFFVDSEWDVEGATAPPAADESVGGGAGVRGTAALRRRFHFVYYVPPPALCPTKLLLESGRPSPTDAITVSAWGGLMIDPAACPGNGAGEEAPPPLLPPARRHIGAEELAPFLRVAVAQLRELVGLPGASPSGLAGGSPPSASPASVPSPAGLAAWEADALVRRQAAAHALEAARSLRSLGILVDGMPGMGVGDEIVGLVRAAAQGGEGARAAAALGDHGGALAEAAGARLAAEAAFFHHTMLPALYFPSEHTLAIYVPLFLPTTLPVVVAAIKEIKHWRKRKAAWRAKQQE